MRITTDLDLALRDTVALYDRNQVYILTDTSVAKCCLPTIFQTLDVPQDHIIIIEEGDENKNLDSLVAVWTKLSNLGATRHSLLLNVGGGVVTDLGGFAASCFKRGIAFVNISTTLLGAVDAALGGKCGINFNNLKNEIGLINPAKEVIIYPPFFSTLSDEQFMSGYAEMVKCGLISSNFDTAKLLRFPIEDYLQNAHEPLITDEYGDTHMNNNLVQLTELMSRSLEIKQYIIDQDIEESSLRKCLNFGHTIGHALEELSISKGQTLPHGYAVMYGMIAELYLSVVKNNFPKESFKSIVNFAISNYGKPQCQCKDYEVLYQLMLHDKKNTVVGQINFTLLADIGRPRINQTADKNEIFEALDYLMNL